MFVATSLEDGLPTARLGWPSAASYGSAQMVTEDFVAFVQAHVGRAVERDVRRRRPSIATPRLDMSGRGPAWDGVRPRMEPLQANDVPRLEP